MADAKAEWVGRVLGVDVGGGAAAPAGAAGAPFLPGWTAAKEAVDEGISRLQRALAATGDEDLAQIAEYGLHGLTERQSVRLAAALRDADTAGTPDARRKAATAAREFKAFLDGSRVVALLEDNPFGVPVPIRSRLGAELDRIAG